MTNFGHKIMLTVLVLLITPPLGFAAATVNASPLTQTSKVTVKGVVKDAAGAPLLGVTVIVKGTSVGTSTSIDGEYQIQCAADAELDFSFIGYETQTLPVANRTLLNVTLKEDAQLMDEVIDYADRHKLMISLETHNPAPWTRSSPKPSPNVPSLT